MLRAGSLMDADDLRGAGRIDGNDFAFGPQALAADDQVVLAAELALDLGERGLHGRLFSGWVKSTNGSLTNGAERMRGSRIRGSHNAVILAR